jgi:hyperosmotically inducible periplasmic protein
MNRGWSLPALSAALAALAGCASSTTGGPQPAVTQLEHAANDALLTTAVKAKLIAVDIDSATSLGVRVDGGTATLTGAVRSAAARERDVAAARSVNGIRAVRDELRVNPALPDVKTRVGDAALAGRIAAAIFTQTGSAGVNVQVHDGVATLSGHVDPSVRAAALATARNTTGIRGVVDRMSG